MAGAFVPHLFGGTRKKASDQQKPQRGRSADGSDRTAAAAQRDAMTELLRSVESVKVAPTGSPVEVLANYFPVACSLTTSFMQYDIQIEPDILNPRIRKELTRKLTRAHAERLKVPAPVCSRNTLFAPRALHEQGQSSIVLTQEGQAGKAGFLGRTYRVTLTHTRDIPPPTAGLSTEYYVVLTNILAEAFEEANFIKIGGRYFDVASSFTAAGDLSHLDGYNNLQLIKGFSFVLHPTSRGLLLNVDLAFRTTRSSTVLDFVKKIQGDHADAREAARTIAEELEGAMCLTTYEHERRRQTFKITKVLFDCNPLTTIPGKRDKPVTYKQYMLEHHNITLLDDKQPMLLSESAREKDADGKPKVYYFIPEVCRFVGQSNRMRADGRLQQQLKRACLVDSATRFNEIFSLVKRFVASAPIKRYLTSWGVKIDPRMTKLTGRLLPQVKVLNGDGREIEQNMRMRSWLIKSGTKIAQLPQAPSKWAVVYPNFAERAIRDFVAALLADTINGVGGNWPQPVYLPFRTDRNPQQNLRMIRNDVLPHVDEDVKFVLFVLPDRNEDVYALVKSTVLQEWKIPSQCVLQSNVMNEAKLQSVASRLGGQMLVKNGGSLWTCRADEFPDSLVCGVDYASGPKGEIVALVACSSDQVKYLYASHGLSARGGVAKLLANAVAEYRKKNRKNPTSIIMYRAGMDEGDVPRILDEEVSEIHQQCKKDNVKLCFLASLKRSHARFYQPPTGCVFDTDVLPPTGFSFLMVPQLCNIGTATAMKFTVLANDVPEIVANGAILETFTYKLCHMFYGWWGATREPSVVMYAQRHADLASKMDPSKALGNAATGSYQAL